MPVMVLGADTPLGEVILNELIQPDREVRAFVSDPEFAARYKARGVKVALGDLSDVSHVEAACLNCFTVVAVGPAVVDGRELAFESDPARLAAGWAEAVAGARITRLIWVGEPRPGHPVRVPEQANLPVAADPSDTAREVARLDDAASLDSAG
jgi:uncharacterized protein YbjT (DUF2867 family)